MNRVKKNQLKETYSSFSWLIKVETNHFLWHEFPEFEICHASFEHISRTEININLIFFLPLLSVRTTCWSAASSLSCLLTDSLHTASQRPSSSSICSCSQWASAVLLLVRSLTERFRVLMHPARFPNSFWKAWGGKKNCWRNCNPFLQDKNSEETSAKYWTNINRIMKVNKSLKPPSEFFLCEWFHQHISLLLLFLFFVLPVYTKYIHKCIKKKTKTKTNKTNKNESFFLCRLF